MTPGGLEVSHIRVKKTGGLQYPLTVHSNVARMLAGCDGNRTLRQLMETMANGLSASRDRVISVVLPVIRSLMERGVLLEGDSPRGQRLTGSCLDTAASAHEPRHELKVTKGKGQLPAAHKCPHVGQCRLLDRLKYTLCV